MNLEQLIKAGEPFTFELDRDVLHQLQGCGDRLATTLRTALSTYLDAYERTPAPFIAVQGRLESMRVERVWWALSNDLAARLSELDGEAADHVRAACRKFLNSLPPVSDVDEDAPDNGDGW